MGAFDDLIPANAGGAGAFDDLVPAHKADPRIGHPEDLTFSEKYIAPALEGLARMDPAIATMLNLGNGNLRGSAIGGAMQGAADPGVAIAQSVGNLVGAGDTVNKAVSDEEKQYQQARQEAGRSGIDLARLGGNTGMTAFMAAVGAKAAPTRLATAFEAANPVVKGTVAGAGFGALQPVTNATDTIDFAKEKGKQMGIGAIAGGATSLLGSLLARVVSPNASTNADVQMLKDAGIRPTVGQTLGGWANTLEEKAQSLPIVGDAISAARRRSIDQFNKAVLDAAEAPVGGAATGAGSDAVAHAGATLRSAYNKAASDVGQINLDTPTFNGGLQAAMDKASGLTQPMRDRFDAILKDEVLRRMQPDGTVLGKNIKAIDSALGDAAAGWKASSAQSERELGGVLRDLQKSFRDSLAAASPEYDAARQAADQGWRVFRLARNAAAAAKNREGVFTPAQLLSAIQSDAGKSAVGEGRAFMQDAATAAQNVLGNKYPDSGTAGRLVVNALALPFHIATAGKSALALGAGATAYTPAVQNLLRAIVSSRPETAPVVANYLRRLALPTTAATVPFAEQRFGQ